MAKDKDIRDKLKQAKSKVEPVDNVQEAEVVEDKHDSTDAYLLATRAEQLEDTMGYDRESTIERIAALDAAFAAELKMKQNDWMAEANDILKALMDAVKKKVDDGDAELKDIIKAIDTISNKYNNFLGLPTNVQGHLHKHQVETVSKKPSEMSEEELDKSIEVTKEFLDYKAIGEAANA